MIHFYIKKFFSKSEKRGEETQFPDQRGDKEKNHNKKD